MAPDPDHTAWIAEFVDLYLSSSFKGKVFFGLNTIIQTHNSQTRFILDEPATDAAMLAGEIDENGFAEWTPTPSPIDNELLAAYERFLGCALPGVFKAYLKHKVMPGLNVYCGTSPTIDPRYPLGWLEWCYQRRLQPLYISRPWLIPFTSGPVSDGALCFDMRRPNSEGDYPVIRIPSPFEEKTEVSANFEVEYQVFDSEFAYFDFMRHYLIYCKLDVNWRDDPFPDWLARCNGTVFPPDMMWDEEGTDLAHPTKQPDV